jgi:hypothetical protein
VVTRWKVEQQKGTSGKRMSKRYVWSKKHYVDVLMGNKKEGITGLRSVARGFDSSVYNIHNFADWSPYQKSKLRKYAKYVEDLEASEKVIVRPRNEKTLRQMQDSFHEEIPSKAFKVAWIPYHSPVTHKEGLKPFRPKVRVTKYGVILETPWYDRAFMAFNLKALVRNPDAEIKRAMSHFPGADTYLIQCGKHESRNSYSQQVAINRVKEWMGYKNWRQWLKGIMGYSLKKKSVKTFRKMIVQGRKSNNERKNVRRRYLSR